MTLTDRIFFFLLLVGYLSHCAPPRRSTADRGQHSLKWGRKYVPELSYGKLLQEEIVWTYFTVN